jgi:hypothetical protein
MVSSIRHRCRRRRCTSPVSSSSSIVHGMKASFRQRVGRESVADHRSI